MAARADSPAVVEARRLVGAAARWAHLRVVGRTDQGRPLVAVTVTDPEAPADDQQHVLVTAGQHGDEPAGRLVALALLRWLLSPEAVETRRRQQIVVVPDVNPDGAAAGLHATPAGIEPNLDHGPEGARTPEGRAVEAVAERLRPDLYLDLHSRSRAGCSYEMVLFPELRRYCEDDRLVHRLAADMADAGEAAGLPHVTHPLTWWTPDPHEPSTTRYCYRRFKSMVVLTESAESPAVSYPRSLQERVGLARVRAALEWGNRRHPKLPFRGYPNALVLGFFECGVLAAGRTAAERRRSRIEIWREADAFDTVRVAVPERITCKELEVHYRGPPLKAVGFVVAAAGRRRVVSVTWNGRPLSPSAWHSWRSPAATYVAVEVRPLPPGRHGATVRFR